MYTAIYFWTPSTYTLPTTPQTCIRNITETCYSEIAKMSGTYNKRFKIQETPKARSDMVR